jgi:hypothetical protein
MLGASVSRRRKQWPLWEIKIQFLHFVRRAAGEKSLCVREILRSATSTQILVVFFCIEANAEKLPKFQVASAGLSYQPSRFKCITIDNFHVRKWCTMPSAWHPPPPTTRRTFSLSLHRYSPCWRGLQCMPKHWKNFKRGRGWTPKAEITLHRMRRFGVTRVGERGGGFFL